MHVVKVPIDNHKVPLGDGIEPREIADEKRISEIDDARRSRCCVVDSFCAERPIITIIASDAMMETGAITIRRTTSICSLSWLNSIVLLFI